MAKQHEATRERSAENSASGIEGLQRKLMLNKGCDGQEEVTAQHKTWACRCCLREVQTRLKLNAVQGEIFNANNNFPEEVMEVQ